MKKINHTTAIQFAIATPFILLLLPSVANAADRWWACGDESWDNAACWSATSGGAGGSGVPVLNDTVNIITNDATTRVIDYASATGPQLGILTVDGLGAGTTTLSIAQDTLNTNNTRIGFGSNSTAFITQSAGAHNTNTLEMGRLGVGTYNMSGSGALNAGIAEIGIFNQAFFNQTGGSVDVTGGLWVSFNIGSSGTYNLSGGTLNTSNTNLGRTSIPQLIGVFNQTGGTHTTDTLTVNPVSSYSLNGGTLTVNNNLSGALDYQSGTLNIGGFSDGVINHTSTGAATLGTVGGQYNLSAGTLNATTISGGGTQTGGIATVDSLDSSYDLQAGTLNATAINLVSSSDNLTVSGGNVNAGTVTLSDGSISQTGGSFAFTALNQTGGSINSDFTVAPGSIYTYSGGTFNGRLTQNGTTTVNADFLLTDGVENNGSMTVGSKTVTFDGAGLDNNGTVLISGGTLTGTGLLINDNVLTGSGEIAGSGGFTNSGTLTQNGGTITFSNTGVNQNTGTINLQFNQQMALTGSGLINEGVINLNGANMIGSAPLTTNSVFSGRGTLGIDVNNTGTLGAKSGNLIVAGTTFTNSGLLKNAVGSNLFIDSTTINHTGSIEVNSAGSVVISSTVTNGAGETVTMKGGTLSTTSLNNASGGNITGFGTFTGDMNNAGNVDLFGTSTLVGDLVNTATGHFLVRNDKTLITGLTTNDGTIETLNGEVVFEGGLLNNGALLFDPSVITTTTINTGENGYMSETGAPGDRFIITEDFENASTRNIDWRTSHTIFQFNGGSRDASNPQTIEAAGADIGNALAGWQNNFAFGTLEIGTSETYVKLVDNSDNSTVCLSQYCEIWNKEALYVYDLILGANTTLDLMGINL